MRTSWIHTLKKVDDLLEILVFDWALHPSRRARTLTLSGLMLGVLAFSAWSPAVSLSPQEAFARGTDLMSRKAQAVESVRLLELASQGMSQDARVWTNLGHAYLNADRKPEALRAYTQAVSLDPSSSNLFFLGYSYIKNDLPEAAIGFYDQILERNTFFYPALAYQGVAHDKAGRYNEAKRNFRKALAYNPRYVPAYFHLGITYVNTKEYSRSIESFLKVISLDPSESAAYYNVACCYSLMGQVDQANEWLQKAMDHGFYDYQHMDQDHDLDGIRSSATYQQLREQARQTWEAEAAR
jgi:tetratricopeptide (TPR) repeat protein